MSCIKYYLVPTFRHPFIKTGKKLTNNISLYVFGAFFVM